MNSTSPNYYQGTLKDLFCSDIQLIDVRAEGEFKKGSFPNAVNIPILNDEQRHLVGICYKEQGQDEAIKLGHELVSGVDKIDKIAAWTNQINKHPNTVIYCFRGGSRSQITQRWLKEAGIDVPIIQGGQKRLRNYLLDNLDEQVEKNDFLVISGNTGSGKTIALNKLADQGYKAIDLEGLANHRGSAFGRNKTEQPSQIDFENGISIQFLKEEAKETKYILIEDESSLVGNVTVYKKLYDKKKASPLFVLTAPIEDRVNLIINDYVKDRWPDFKDLPDAYESFYDFFKRPLDRIQKKLGGQKHTECIAELKNAVKVQENGSFEAHGNWVETLLTDYYDKFYEKSIDKREKQVVGTGNFTVLKEYLSQ